MVYKKREKLMVSEFLAFIQITKKEMCTPMHVLEIVASLFSISSNSNHFSHSELCYYYDFRTDRMEWNENETSKIKQRKDYEWQVTVTKFT